MDYLKNFGDPSRMVFYVDGSPALEKKETHLKTEALKTAEVAFETLSYHVSQGKPPTMMFKNVENGLRGTFQVSMSLVVDRPVWASTTALLYSRTLISSCLPTGRHLVLAELHTKKSESLHSTMSCG
ncbi:hypothetical protein BGZ83_000177 [Gryganskiella cystojenkinii]|nr:hypothetical protein BGZ83_000177 [Gryganskiella cystojenkinii]